MKGLYFIDINFGGIKVHIFTFQMFVGFIFICIHVLVYVCNFVIRMMFVIVYIKSTYIYV